MLAYANTMLATLHNKQKELGLSDSAFARKLGCSREWWNQVKNGRKPLSKEMVIRAMQEQAFPELTFEAIAFLRKGNHGKGRM